MRLFCKYILTILVFITLPAYADDFPIQEDVATIDGIMKAYYEVVSRKAGEPMQSERDKSLHLPASQVITLTEGESKGIKLNRMTIDDFHNPPGNLAKSGFFEYELSRKVMYHGAQALVWSTYEAKETMDGPVIAKGINSIQLYNDGSRWWIVAEMWDARKNLKIDPKYLP